MARMTRRRKSLFEAARFFKQHAGGIVGQASAGALRLAKAEAEAEKRGITFEWSGDDDADLSWMSEAERKNVSEVLCAVAKRNGKACASLCGIVDPDRNYGRVVEAELAMEALSSKTCVRRRRR